LIKTCAVPSTPPAVAVSYVLQPSVVAKNKVHLSKAEPVTPANVHPPAATSKF